MISMKSRNTIQRSLVLEAVNKLRCHATADQIYEEIVKDHPTISKATVYRNLNLLSEMGMIRKLEIPGGADRFDHICKEHCHVKCEKCGRVFDIEIPYIDGLDNLVENRNGFELTGYDILFRGICPGCRASSDGEK